MLKNFKTYILYISTSIQILAVLYMLFSIFALSYTLVPVSWDASGYTFLYNYGLPFIILLLAWNIPFAPNILHSLLSLIALFLVSVIILLSIKLEFLAFIFLIVYVGAVSILFLFVVMLFNIQPTAQSATRRGLTIRTLSKTLLLATLFILWQMLKQQLVVNNGQKIDLVTPYNSNFRLIDLFPSMEADITIFTWQFYDYHSLLFLLLGVILFIAMIGAVVLVLGFNLATPIAITNKSERTHSIHNWKFATPKRAFHSGPSVCKGHTPFTDQNPPEEVEGSGFIENRGGPDAVLLAKQERIRWTGKVTPELKIVAQEFLCYEVWLNETASEKMNPADPQTRDLYNAFIQIWLDSVTQYITFWEYPHDVTKWSAVQKKEFREAMQLLNDLLRDPLEKGLRFEHPKAPTTYEKQITEIYSDWELTRPLRRALHSQLPTEFIEHIYSPHGEPSRGHPLNDWFLDGTWIHNHIRMRRFWLNRPWYPWYYNTIPSSPRLSKAANNVVLKTWVDDRGGKSLLGWDEELFEEKLPVRGQPRYTIIWRRYWHPLRVISLIIFVYNVILYLLFIGFPWPF